MQSRSIVQKGSKIVAVAWLHDMNEDNQDESIKKLLKDIKNLKGVNMSLLIYNDFEEFLTKYKDRCQSDEHADIYDRFQHEIISSAYHNIMNMWEG